MQSIVNSISLMNCVSLSPVAVLAKMAYGSGMKNNGLRARVVFTSRRVRAAVGVTQRSNRIGIDHLNNPSTLAYTDRPRNVPWRCQRA